MFHGFCVGFFCDFRGLFKFGWGNEFSGYMSAYSALFLLITITILNFCFFFGLVILSFDGEFSLFTSPFSSRLSLLVHIQSWILSCSI